MPAAATKKQKKRTYARHRAISRKGNERVYESDGKYFLKLVVYIIFGSVWLKFASPLSVGGALFNGIPVGMFVGLLVVNRFEKYQYDRKIWYALLVLVAIVSYFLPSGIVI